MYWQQFYPNWKIPAGYHVHHIKPKCTFEDNDDPRINHPSNLIALHPDDHVSIHKCRGDKLVPGKLILAVTGHVVSAETRAKMSKIHKGKIISNAQRELLSEIHTGRVVSDETKAKMSLVQTGTKNAMYGKTHSAATKQKMSDSHVGMTGTRHSAATKRKMSMANRGKMPWNAGKQYSKIECPHCVRMIGENNYDRYHGDNCKLNISG